MAEVAMVFTVRLNDVSRNRTEFDKVSHALTAHWHAARQARIARTVTSRRERLLEGLGPNARGLLVWHFGAGWESRTADEIPVGKIEEFVSKYA